MCENVLALLVRICSPGDAKISRVANASFEKNTGWLIFKADSCLRESMLLKIDLKKIKSTRPVKKRKTYENSPSVDAEPSCRVMTAPPSGRLANYSDSPELL